MVCVCEGLELKFMNKLKSTLKIIIISILAIALVLLILFVLFLYSISCKDVMKKNYYSPNKIYSAELYYRDCGGVGSSNWIIDIINRKKVLFSKDRYERVFISHKSNVSNDINVEWIDGNNLRISYPEDDEISEQITSWQDIKIEYVPINATEK